MFGQSKKSGGIQSLKMAVGVQPICVLCFETQLKLQLINNRRGTNFYVSVYTYCP